MSAFRKRPRLYSVSQRDVPRGFASQRGYYDEGDELGVDGDETDYDGVLDYDADLGLRQQKAAIDNKLKNTFESIFAKYERDFEGIGDEIDLATGEIVVNNGHLYEMQGELDAGLRGRLEVDSDNVYDSFEEESLGDDGDEGSGTEEGIDLEGTIQDSEDGSGDEEDEDDDDDAEEDEEGEEGTTTGDSMDDDDLILRGFTQATRFLQASPSPDLGMIAPRSFVPSQIPRFQPRRNEIPQHHLDILEQFGPEQGPRIVAYIQQQENVAKQSHVEEAWRVPELPRPGFAPTFEPVLTTHALQKPFRKAPAIQRSQSPEASTSLWAIPQLHRRRKIKKAVAPFQRLRYSSVGSDASGPLQLPKTRNGFTREDDETMLEWIAKARQDGSRLPTGLLWKALAAQHPRHTWASWQARYRRKFYMQRDSEAPLDENTIVDIDESQTHKPRFTAPPQRVSDRPSRIRKPAQRDERIISWSEAVNTIASVDPDLHAGIIDDAKRAKNGEQTWISEQQIYHQPNHVPLNRPVSAHDVDELQRDFVGLRSAPARRFSDSRLTAFERPATQTPGRSVDGKWVPCPHTDCREKSSNVYRVDTIQGQDASELSLHLLAKHRTTPFPCGEANCDQKGGNGFFKPKELVEHVKNAHPHTEALQRLQDRVDPTLLPAKEERASIDLTIDSPEPRGQHISAIIRSSRVPSSRRAFSSSESHVQTTTPTGIKSTQGEASVLTPLTSFSSLPSNKSSESVLEKEIRDSQEPPDSSATQDPHNTLPRMPTNLSSHVLDNISSGQLYEVDEPIFSDISMDDLPGPKRCGSDMLHLVSAPMESAMDARNQDPDAGLFNSSFKSPRSVKRKTRGYQTIDHISRGRINKQPRTNSTKETFTRNTVPPSHEFSDEEGSVPEPVGVHQFKELRHPASLPQPEQNVAIPLAAIIPPSTPHLKRKVFRGPLRRVLAEDDVDELSMGPDDIKILSSHTKGNAPLFGASSGIKREDTVGPSLNSVTTSKKRKFQEVLADDEIDELGADACFGKSTSSHTRIKKEVDLENTPMVHRIKAQRKQTKRDYREEAKKLGDGPSPLLNSSVLRNAHTGRSGTPLLDLTPSRPPLKALQDQEVRDSEEPLASSSLNLSHLVSTARDGLLTPTKSKQGSQRLPSNIGAAIVVKTPNGSYKRCGEGGFRCGRSFCFRCSSNSATKSTL